MDLITYVIDRKSHDMRYAIDSRKLQNELGWEASLLFEEGIEETVKWYLENLEWMDNVTSGDYQRYYKNMYRDRQLLAAFYSMNMKVTEDTIEVVKEHFRKVFDYIGLDLEDEISEIAEDDEEVCVDIGSVETNFDIAEFLIKTEKIESLSYDDYCVRCGRTYSGNELPNENHVKIYIADTVNRGLFPDNNMTT